jgi:hypothetical protein
MRLFLTFLFFSSIAFSWAETDDSISAFFSGRVSRVNKEAGLVRMRFDFANMKYINKKDKIQFWDERGARYKCKGYVIGKTNNYILLKVPELEYCMRFILVGSGTYLKFYSQDMVNNLKMGKELISILLKKRLAMSSRLTREKIALDSHIEKVNTLNVRYKLLRDKLEAEWRGELGSLEVDRVVSLRNYKEFEGRVMEIDHKLEKYRVEDGNLKLDRWALDPRLHYRK